ncbi:9716_t:CDS:2 [Acaulospora morrowiae]|uniref:9716_t:CDS:1 n=1 Tax=Acaulospora morrowiae TaxID=94023 RepID=A0A9N8ZSC2_9GLOM|nr:9716_t:CDS:2 [Acaulospora morrowiae]
MGGRQSKTAVVGVPQTSLVKTDGKAERRKKFRSWRSAAPALDGNSINDAWRFAGNGKRIHNLKNSKLLAPLVDEEAERLRRQHRLYKRIWQNNFSAPVEEKLKSGGARVLDVGCGPGTWTIEMSEAYPLSSFIGVDFMPIFPQEKPENAKFIQANILDGLPFLDDTFDFVHMRLLVTAFTTTEWEQKVIPEIIRVTRQGGWVEFMESDIQYCNEGPTTARLTNSLMTIMKSKGFVTPINSYVPQSMEANEKFIKGIQTEEKSCFVGHWARELGQMAVDDITKGWSAVKSPMSTLMKVKSHEYDETVAIFAKEVEQYRTFFKTWRFFGQKAVTTSLSSSISTPSKWNEQEQQQEQQQ